MITLLWRRVGRVLQQANTWLVIALVVIAGWTIDALRMFLEMHDVLSASMADFASHFWYAVPVIVAVMVLGRLRPRADLLGLSVHDETGRLVHQEGDFRLDEFAARGALAALPNDGHPGLHGISLSSGARIYFIRQGAYTLMLGYSKPAAPEILAAGVRRVQAHIPATTFDLLHGLDASTAALAANVARSPSRRSVLAFLYRYRRISMELDDLAYRVGRGEAEVRQALEDLVLMRLVQPMCVCERTFYHLNRDPTVLARLDRLFAWQAQWQTQAQRLDNMVS